MKKFTDVRDDSMAESLAKHIDPAILVPDKKEGSRQRTTQEEEDHKDVEEDYDFSREKYKDLLGKADQAIEAAIDLALESEHPRAFEVVSQMLKNSSDMTGELLKLQKLRKDIKKKEDAPSGGGTQTNTTNNAIFVGSTTDLQKILKDTLSGKKDTEESQKPQIGANSGVNVEAETLES